MADVNLTTGKVSDYDVSDRDRERFLGGRFLSTAILFRELAPGADPLSPDNVLIVMTSPLTGTGAPSSSRFDISAKSPATNLIGHSNSGGSFGMRMKRAGFDGLVIRGRAKEPVYLEVEDGRVRIKDAGRMWGMDTEAAQEAMGKGGTLAIGPAGENLVKFASVASGERCHGRTGLGAVMGSKNLKGMVARGGKKPSLADPEGFGKTIKKWAEMLKKHPATGDFLPKYGTAGFLPAVNAGATLPTKNFSRGSFDRGDAISGQTLAETLLVGRQGCVTCPIQCGRTVMVDGKKIKGPEFEVLGLVGSNLEVDDLSAIIRLNREMDLLGMDTISCGNVLGFTAELYEKGLWDAGVRFGKTEGLLEILRDMAHRRDAGADLAEGVRFLAEKYGGADFAAHAKGLELPAYEPRSCVGHGLGYATANRGGCHLDGGYVVYFEVNGPVTMDPLHFRSKPGWVVLDQNLLAAISAGGNCLFTSWTFLPPFVFKLPEHKLASSVVSKALTLSWPSIEVMLRLPPSLMKFNLPLLPHSKAIAQATGMAMDFGKFLQAGNRGYTLERLFNLREGVEKDTLPKRFLKERLPEGPGPLDLSAMLPAYYSLRGWDENGRPKRKTLKKLDLEEFEAPGLP
ncbi:MAG: aldehyde ferredoxin oxidoreductase family protein [Deltaproteobacteria bacterium]|nr:aldehyde ferredoxin oxidoreductase family protein [Deltaproteobacteria bacterium]